MSFVNTLLRGLFDALLWPFAGFPAIVGLAVISVPIAIAMLLVFKATSNQEKLAAVKAQIHAGLFEIRLFNDDLRAIFRAQFEILRHNARYLGLSLAPMVWVIIPFILVVAQLQFHYGYRGLEPGERTLLKVQLRDGDKLEAGSAIAAAPSDGEEGLYKPIVALDVPPGLRVETPALWIPSLHEMSWRIVADQPGDYEIGIGVEGERYTKTVRVTNDVRRISPIRVDKSFLKQVMYPAEAPLPGSAPIEAITLNYQEAAVGILGFETHWMIVFFVLVIAFAFALKGAFRVTI